MKNNIVTILASSRFEKETTQLAEEFMKKGVAVFYPHKIQNYTPEEKLKILDTRKACVKVSGVVIVYNAMHYIGGDTLYFLENHDELGKVFYKETRHRNSTIKELVKIVMEYIES